jgi:hypothetical protein
MNGLTARMALDLLELPAGATVAVTGAAGAVGGYAVQLAKADGYRVIADAAPKDEQLVKDLGADTVLPRGTEFPELVREVVPDGVDGLVDTAGIAGLAVRAVRDGGRVASSVGGTQVSGERGIETRHTFVPQYARQHAKLDRLRQLAEKGSRTPRVARTRPAEQAPEALLEAGRPPRTSGAHFLSIRSRTAADCATSAAESAFRHAVPEGARELGGIAGSRADRPSRTPSTPWNSGCVRGCPYRSPQVPARGFCAAGPLAVRPRPRARWAGWVTTVRAHRIAGFVPPGSRPAAADPYGVSPHAEPTRLVRPGPRRP